MVNEVWMMNIDYYLKNDEMELKEVDARNCVIHRNYAVFYWDMKEDEPSNF